MSSGSENLGNLFAHHAPGERVALVDLRTEQPREITYAALHRGCDAVARALAARGLEPGTRIGILSLNRAEYIEVIFGALRAGCVPVPINVKLPRETVEYVIRDAGIRLLFVESAWAEGVPGDVAAVDFDRDYPDFVDPGPFQAVAPGPDQVSMQPYTSGTTGRPKGVLLAHQRQLWFTRTLMRYRRLRADDVVLVSAPFYHKNALVAIKTALLPGACIVLLPRFDAVRSLEAIHRYRCSMITGVPTMMHLLLAEDELLARTDRSSVRTISMGSAPASDALLTRLRETFPAAQIFLNYGVTEGGPIMLGWFHPEGRPRPAHSVGYPIPGCEYRFVGGPHPREGELHVRNPGVALGYHNLPQETARRFEDGWFKTGDVLRQDEEGWFYFVGRVDDMFVSGGENIYPGEVETVLERHPDILQAVVLPFPHEVKGEVPYAFVVARPGSRLDEEQVKQHVLRHAPAYAHPRAVFFVPQIPLAGTNKVDHRALRALAASRTPSEERSSPWRKTS